METSDVLRDAFGRAREGFAEVVRDLDGDALAYRPDAHANSIAWLVWHATRIHDDHVAEIAGREQAWTDEGWAERFDLPFDVHDTGYGHGPDDVAAVHPPGPELLVGYQDAVFARTAAYLDNIDAAELGRIIDRRWDPPVSVGVRLVSVVSDQLQHLGQAGYVRGLYERRRGG